MSEPPIRIHDRLTQLSREIVDGRGGGDELDGLAGITDTRSLDEVRADVFSELLLTSHATPEESDSSIPEARAIRGQVQITVPVLSLLGRSDEPADLAGWGPVGLDVARELTAGAAGWDRVLTHPISGCVLAVDRYRPSEEQKRLLRVRDEHCRAPGCRQPAHRCDVDHTIARAHDGPTVICNLAHLCRRHHTLKHHSAWRVRQRPDGVLEWTSPLGRVYDDEPARTLAFTAVDPAPF